jgi:hypothetical protein
MLPFAPARMIVVKKEEKEAKVRLLLIDALAQRARSTAVDAPVLRVLAQSANSPVARAVAALRADLARAGATVEIVLAKPDQTQPVALDLTAASYRHLADVRFHDAHELLVLGTTTCWVGDCMRRDPSTRDSFELHGVDNVETARWALMCFAQIWGRAIPFVIPAAEPEQSAVMALAGDLAAVLGDAANPVTILTRH